MSVSCLNLLIKSSKLHSLLILTANLNLADLEEGFIFISSLLGVIGFLFFKLKHLILFTSTGEYLDEFFISE